MVTRVESPCTIGRTLAGSFTSLRCFEWLISRPAMSTSIDSGIESAGHTTSTWWVTILTAPPRFTPGDWSVFLTCTGMRTRMVAPSPRRRKSTWIGLSRTGSTWKSRGIVRCFLPSTSMLQMLTRKRPAWIRCVSSLKSSEIAIGGWLSP